MKIRLTTNILFEYAGFKKTLFKSGQTFSVNRKCYKWALENDFPHETEEVVGYWIGTERSAKSQPLKNLNMIAPDSLIETVVLLHECEIVDE